MSQSADFYWLNAPSVVIDDSDPAIRYDNGTWNTFTAADLRSRNFKLRTPLFNTLHVLQVFSGSLSYEFTGTYEQLSLHSIINDKPM